MKQKSIKLFVGCREGDVRVSILQSSGLGEYERLLRCKLVVAHLHPTEKRWNISLTAKGEQAVKKIEEKTITLY